MPDIIVQRGAGVRQGKDVIDPLLSTIGACLARGRMELDEHTEGLQPVSMLVLYRPGLLLGDLLEVYDAYYGTVWYGKLVGIEHTVEGPEITTSLRVVRPTDFEVT